MIQWRKIISFDFHHIPQLSIGFKLKEAAEKKCIFFFLTMYDWNQIFSQTN